MRRVADFVQEQQVSQPAAAPQAPPKDYSTLVGEIIFWGVLVWFGWAWHMAGVETTKMMGGG
jgi:hypothetical protein